MNIWRERKTEGNKPWETLKDREQTEGWSREVGGGKLDGWWVIFLSLFILRQRGRVHKQGRGRERGRKRTPSRLHAVSTEPDMGLKLMDRVIQTWAKIQSWMLNWLSHPGTPRWAMAINEGTYDDHWVLCIIDKLLNSTPETNIARYVN